MSITEGKVGSRNVIGESSSAHALSIRPFTLRDSEDTMSAQTGEGSTLAAFMVRLNNKAVTFQQEYGDRKKSVVHFSRSAPKVEEVPTSSSTSVPTFSSTSVPTFSSTSSDTQEGTAVEEVSPQVEEVPTSSSTSSDTQEGTAVEEASPQVEEVPTSPSTSSDTQEGTAVEEVSPQVEEVPTSSSTSSDTQQRTAVEGEVFYGSAPQEQLTPFEAPDMQPHVENSMEYEGSPFEGITFIDEAELEMEEEIAKGGQGHVHLAKWKRDSSVPVPVVVKVMNGKYDLRSLQSLPWWRQLRKVVELGSDENLEGCCRVLGVCVKATALWIIMERFAGDLKNFIDQKIVNNSTNWTNSFAANLLTLHMMWSIATGMEILHANGILHRDLKASNILLRGGGTKSSTARFGAKIEQVKEFTGKFERFFSTEKKLGDFGSLLKLFEEFQTAPKTSSEPFWFTELSAHVRFVIGDYESSEGVCGTRFWRAPEVLQALKSGVTPVFTEKSDVYSYAMVCYEILTGKTPFPTEAASDYDVVLDGGRPQLPAGLDKGLSNLLQRCWLSDPDQRPDFTEIKRFLSSETAHLTTQDWLSLGNPLGKLRIASWVLSWLALRSQCKWYFVVLD